MKRIGGIAVRYMTPATVKERGKRFTEMVSPTAFRDYLASGKDTRCYIGHDPNLIVGRTSNNTLKLRSTATALEFEVILPDTGPADDLYELVKRGDVKGCSFMISNAVTSWLKGETRIIDKSDLYEITMTSAPIYDTTQCWIINEPIDLTGVPQATKDRIALVNKLMQEINV